MKPLLAPEFRRALGYIRPYRARLVAVLGISLIGTALALVLPYLFRGFVDRALVGRDMAALAEMWDPLESTCRHASLSIL